MVELPNMKRRGHRFQGPSCLYQQLEGGGGELLDKVMASSPISLFLAPRFLCVFVRGSDSGNIIGDVILHGKKKFWLRGGALYELFHTIFFLELITTKMWLQPTFIITTACKLAKTHSTPWLHACLHGLWPKKAVSMLIST
jgi:hypothetical protein